MNWSDIAKSVSSFAPAVGAALGGPPGAAIGAAIAGLLGVNATPTDVSQALKTDPEAAVKLKALEVQLATAQLNADSSDFTQRSQTVRAEITGESWLQRNWRPLTMMVIVTIIANNYLVAPYINAIWPGAAPTLELPARLWDLMTLGMGGYVVGRSFEKTAGNIATALRKGN